MRISLIVAPPCGSDSSQAPVQRSLILTPNRYRKSGVRPSGMGELQGANTKSSKNRSNKKETAHTTHNFHFMSSVAISVHCCLHWCSHRHLASVLAPCIYPGVRTLSFTCVPSIWFAYLKLLKLLHIGTQNGDFATKPTIMHYRTETLCGNCRHWQACPPREGPCPDSCRFWRASSSTVPWAPGDDKAPIESSISMLGCCVQ